MARHINKNSEVFRGYCRIKYVVPASTWNPQDRIVEDETWVGPYSKAGLVRNQLTRFKKQKERYADPGSLMVLEEYVEVNDGWRRA